MTATVTPAPPHDPQPTIPYEVVAVGISKGGSVIFTKSDGAKQILDVGKDYIFIKVTP